MKFQCINKNFNHFLNTISFPNKGFHTEITALIFSVDPNPLFDECINAVNNQSLQPNTIEIIKNIQPVSKAVHFGIFKVKTKYLIIVDGDMILYPKAFETLYRNISKCDKCGEVIFQLKDPILGNIEGIRIYRMEALMNISLDFKEDKGWDRYIRRELEKKKYLIKKFTKDVGLHHPIYLPQEVYWKYRFIGQKTRYYQAGFQSLDYHFLKLAKYWKEKDHIIALYAIAGLIEGLQDENIDQPLDYNGRSENPGYLKIKKIVDSFSK